VKKIEHIEEPRPGLAIGVAKQLDAAGYVEEEFVVRGTADLYTYDDSWNTVQRRTDVPYRTRVIVRRPAAANARTSDAVIEAPATWRRPGRARVARSCARA
jgi:hypothetical protein